MTFQLLSRILMIPKTRARLTIKPSCSSSETTELQIYLTEIATVLLMWLCSRRKDPLVNLNYAVFLYKHGDRNTAARQFAVFEQRSKSSGVEPDAEVRADVILFSL